MSDTHITFPQAKRLILFTVLLLVGVAIAFLFISYVWKVLFVAFAGLMLAIILRTFTEWVEHVTHLSPKPAYLAAVLCIFAVCALAGWFLVPRIIAQAAQIVAVIPSSLTEAQQYLNSSQWGQYLVQFAQRAAGRANAGLRVATAAVSAFDALGGIVVILVVGFYGALNPAGYVNGLLQVVPEHKRGLARHVCSEIAYTLRWWLLGQLVPMAVLGVFTMVGLWALHVPLAFTLGLFTAVMIFVPYLGALASEIPAVLVALTQGPTTMIYVLILYLVVHALEAYILTPLVQKRAARLPPIITILSEFLMWSLTGVLGVVIATPLAAALLTAFRVLYLHQDIER